MKGLEAVVMVGALGDGHAGPVMPAGANLHTNFFATMKKCIEDI